MADTIGYCFFAGFAHGFTGLGGALLILAIFRRFRENVEEV